MPYQISPLSALVARARSAFRAYLPGTDAWAWPNNINPSAKVVGGAVSEVFSFAEYISRQKFAGTADGENLELHAAEVGLARRPPAPARGFTAITAAGPLAVGAGALLQRTDGVTYRALAAGSLAGAGTLAVELIATSNGKATTAIPGTPLAIVSGVSDPLALAIVDVGGIVGGNDVEPDGDFWTTDLGTLRGRVLFRKRNPPHGGNPADYVQWATDVSGVTRVFVERLWNGSGTVRVFVLMDDLYPNGIPPDAEIARVADYVETVRPAGSLVTISAPLAVPVAVQIQGLFPDTTTIRENAGVELRAAFRKLSRVAGADNYHSAMPYLAFPTAFSRSWLWQAVANASGEERHAIAAPTADIALAPGQMATLGNVSFLP